MFHIFCVADVRYETSRDEDIIVQEHDPYDKIYQNLPLAHHVLRKVPNCEYCGAVKFPGEGDAFCCRKGNVNIFIPDVPGELSRLFTSRKTKMHCISEITSNISILTSPSLALVQ